MVRYKVREVQEIYLLSKADIRALVFTQRETEPLDSFHQRSVLI